MTLKIDRTQITLIVMVKMIYLTIQNHKQSYKSAFHKKYNQ